MASPTERKLPDADDPMELVGVGVSGEADDEAVFADMATALAEEFLRIGYTPQQIVRIFSDPFYRMTHAVWRAWGEQRVRDMIETVARRYGAGGSG